MLTNHVLTNLRIIIGNFILLINHHLASNLHVSMNSVLVVSVGDIKYLLVSVLPNMYGPADTSNKIRNIVQSWQMNFLVITPNADVNQS